jgi:hypothetical protein
MNYLNKLNFGFQKKEQRRVKSARKEYMSSQVRKVLSDADQQLILMVRG